MAFFKGAAKEAQRAMMLQKARDKERQDIDAAKRKLEAELRIATIHNKFAVHYDAVENQLSTDTVGLVTLDEMRAKQEMVVSAREQQVASTEGRTRARLVEGARRRAQESAARQLHLNKLSFDPDDEEEEDDDPDEEKSSVGAAGAAGAAVSTSTADATGGADATGAAVEEDVPEKEDADEKQLQEDEAATAGQLAPKRRRLGKNPDVDTSFLPDRERDQEENRLREELRREWVVAQNAIKNQEISIVYSFWDGSGHRRALSMKKGHSIQQFLRRCLDQLRKSFNELRHVTEDQLMYVKEDLIIPYHYTFYDFIVTQARGKSGPLFHFDVHEDVRLRHDAGVEKDESHAGKVCLRSWYERNKHIFPASRWEPYDPTKNWDQYSVKDKMAPKITVK